MRCRVVNSKVIYSENRLDGSYHNAESNIYDIVIKAHSAHKLSYYCSDIFTSGRNKRVYTSEKFGFPFLSNSDASSQNPFSNCKFCSRKYTNDDTAFLKEGMILTGRVGAIGQTIIVPKYWEERRSIGSDNIIRIKIRPESKNGFIYAYLASRIGNLAFWKYATGGVQPFITDTMVGNLPIPDMESSLMNDVDDLIHCSVEYRERAESKYTEAIHCISDYCNAYYLKTKGLKVSCVKSNSVRKSFNTRLDPTFFINDGIDALRTIKNTKKLKEFSIRMWYPGIFKRAYVKNGFPYIKGSSMFEFDPFKNCDFLSKTRTPGIEELWLKQGMLLISCAGICGLAKLITKEYEEKQAIGSPDIIRLVSTDSLLTVEYLFAYLQLPYVYDYLQSLKYGSVIERFDIYNLENLPVIIPTEQVSTQVTSLIDDYLECLYESYKAEEKAIKLIEAKIEFWTFNR